MASREGLPLQQIFGNKDKPDKVVASFDSIHYQNFPNNCGGSLCSGKSFNDGLVALLLTCPNEYETLVSGLSGLLSKHLHQLQPIETQLHNVGAVAVGVCCKEFTRMLNNAFMVSSMHLPSADSKRSFFFCLASGRGIEK